MKPLSKRAEKLLERLKTGRFYRVYDDKTPRAMAELEAAGLVGQCGRAVTFVLCYVPTGYQPAKREVFPK